MPAATRSIVSKLRAHKRVVVGVVATAGGALLLATCVAGVAAVHSPTRSSSPTSVPLDSGPPGGVGVAGASGA